MVYFIPTIILRHKKENLKKCSLRGLENRADICFLTYPEASLAPLENLCILTFDAPLLTEQDQHHSLFIIDGTWRYAGVMGKTVPQNPSYIYRSLPPHFQTAYPRRQLDCPDPTRGLASVEALFIAYTLLGRNTTGILDNYYWKEDFLQKNSLSISYGPQIGTYSKKPV
ncbi:hypothetical protein [Rhabdochlamydiaceae symbiont of Dictyostelium giganteum]|uniref:hypothetical protein n=1 Tax=Rhabdochlamydiaceae symbiont of Dictyostelium giganteum TaxID=3342349 RepID=UPI00384BF90D